MRTSEHGVRVDCDASAAENGGMGVVTIVRADASVTWLRVRIRENLTSFCNPDDAAVRIASNAVATRVEMGLGLDLENRKNESGLIE